MRFFYSKFKLSLAASGVEIRNPKYMCSKEKSLVDIVYWGGCMDYPKTIHQSWLISLLLPPILLFYFRFSLQTGNR